MKIYPEVFDNYSKGIKKSLLEVREIVLKTAAQNKEIGELDEVLRWGQPTFLTRKTKSGTMIRIDQIKNEDHKIGIFFHCQSRVIEMIKLKYGDKLDYDGNRGVLFDTSKRLPKRVIKDCAFLALRYNLIKSHKK